MSESNCAGSSILDTLKHSRRVDELLLQVVSSLLERVTKHDQSKMEDPELAVFDEFGPRLRGTTYGTEEYYINLEQMKVALDHHYANNRHHPEHHDDGVSGMTLVDLIEMLSDWKAATERHDDGDLSKSLKIQQDRFGISEQLMQVLTNTAVQAGWIPQPR